MNRRERPLRDSGQASSENYWLLLDDLEIHREELRLRANQLAEVQSALEAVEDLLGEAPLGYLTLDSAGTILDCNITAGRMLGIDPRQAPGWSFTAFAPPEHKRAVLNYLSKCRRVDEPVRTELTLKSRAEGPFPCQVMTRRCASADGAVTFRITILDLSDRKRIEDALQASERRFSAAVEASGAGVFELEIPFEGLLYVNHRLADILGYSRAELAEPAQLPGWIDLRLHAGDRERLRNIYGELASRERDSYQGDVRFLDKSGSWRWIRAWAKAAPARENGRCSVVGAAMDVTLEKERALESERRTQQLRGLATELYHVEERERRDLATELHDNLAQLIVATKMKLGLISPWEDREKLNEQLLEALQLLDRADESVRSLTFSLSPPVLDELGLSSAVRWLAQDIEKQFGLHVDLEEDRGEEELVAPSLRFMLFRSIRELLINAAKHADTSHARVGLESRGGTVRIAVEDEGKGFDRDRARAEGSRGFGLFSIQERVESIGGTMNVRSEPGHGTSVTIQLRNADRELYSRKGTAHPAGVGKTTASAQPHSTPRTIRVLLADDHELVRGAIARLIDGQPDIQVIGEASDGESVLELVDLLNPDVVLMDVTMAGVGGIEATGRILERRPEIRVIGLSMHESSDIASAMKNAGAFDYLRKSVPTQVLLDSIRKAAIAGRESAGDLP